MSGVSSRVSGARKTGYSGAGAIRSPLTRLHIPDSRIPWPRSLRSLDHGYGSPALRAFQKCHTVGSFDRSYVSPALRAFRKCHTVGSFDRSNPHRRGAPCDHSRGRPREARQGEAGEATE